MMGDNRTRAKSRNEPPMSEPLAYFLTWTTYGTWLPGDERGWIRREKGIQLPSPPIKSTMEGRMNEKLCTLDTQQRELVEKTIYDHCGVRGWHLHAVNCRSNHVHVIVSADRKPEAVRDQFKSWCTRKLKEVERSTQPIASVRKKWWTEKGSCRYIGDCDSLEMLISYVLDAQDRKERDAE